MALMADDLFAENILDEPDELEQVQEGEVIENQDYDMNFDDNNDETTEENKENNEDKEEKKKRKKSQKPKLNILKLMDKNGLGALEGIFKDVNFKGKGYEYEDLKLIMHKMEIWAHQLYPSLQFDDCLAKLEKLGHNNSVSTYVKKIRMGLEVEIPRDEVIDMEDDDEDDVNKSNELCPSSSTDAFDQLIGSQEKTMHASTDEPPGLTTEQRERMLRNRLIAEQRRMEKMKARQQQNNSINDCETVINPVSQVDNVQLEAQQNVSSSCDFPNNITVSNESNLQLYTDEINKDLSLSVIQTDKSLSATSDCTKMDNQIQNNASHDDTIMNENINDKTPEMVRNVHSEVQNFHSDLNNSTEMND